MGSNELRARKPLRLQGYDYSTDGCYFVTICVQDKHQMFGKISVADVGATVPGRPQIELSEIGQQVESAIQYNNEHNDNMFSKYAIMPNHIHLIVTIKSAGDRGRSPLQNIVRNLKSYITKQIGFSPWQRSYYDRIIRDETEYQRI